MLEQLRPLFPYLKKYRASYSLGTICVFFNNGIWILFPQIIRRADNPLYFDILAAFKAHTGVPVLVNTSFNVHEEPIVNKPEECLKALQDGRVDFVTTADAVWIRA